MTRPPPLPDLDTLSLAQKDALIVSLWQTIDMMEKKAEAPATPSPAPAPEASDLRMRIRRTPPSQRARETPQAGNPIWRAWLTSKVTLGVLIAIGIGFGADLAIGAYQKHALAESRQRLRELENAAFAGLYVELADVTYEPDGKSYRARLTLQNTDPAAPLYIMLDPARVFVQTGLTWQGVGTEPGAGTRVVKLDGAEEALVTFQADVDNWTELMPGYMHVRIESLMLISRSSAPKDDLVERANRFYVYLKPRGADDAAIKRRMNFPGTPPIFIPMPPH
jgi:hypothetical protein